MKRFTLAFAILPVTAAVCFAALPWKTMNASADEGYMDATAITFDEVDKEAVNESNCFDACATLWLPLKLVNVDDTTIDKTSDRALHAVMTFSGLLGAGEMRHPLSWASLNYDSAEKGGYLVNLAMKQPEGAPRYDRGAEYKWTPDHSRRVDSDGKAPRYWTHVAIARELARSDRR